MHDALLIAKREYLERVRSKVFVFTTFLMPLVVAIIMGGSYFAATSTGGPRHLVIASSDATLAREVAQELQESQKASHIEIDAPVSSSHRAELMRRVETKEIDGALWLAKERSDEQNAAIYYSRSAADLVTSGHLRAAINQAILREHLAALGVADFDIKTWTEPVELRTLQVKAGKASGSSSVGSFIGAYLMIFLLYFTVISYGINVARSVIEEKTSRVFEVLLSATTPKALMAGKLLGVGAAALTQIGIWIVLATGGGVSFAARHGMEGGLGTLGITPSAVAFFVIYFLLGFLFYSALSAAFGASVSSEQEIQQLSFLIVTPLFIGIVLMNYILANPNAPAVVALSLFPPCTPIVMYLRMAAQQPPSWQVWLSIVLMVASIYCMLWVASRIYRVGILMYGKRATLAEMLRWLRYS
jgi:ABC-2 type transport system permease protein